MKEFSQVYLEEKQELIQEIKYLKMETEEIEKTKSDFRLQQFFLKWTFLAQLRKLKTFDPHDKHHTSCHIERQFFARQMNRLNDMNGMSVQQLKDDLKEARQELNQFSQLISEIEYKNFVSFYF